MELIEDAVEPLSQSLSVFRLAFRLRPGKNSDSPLATDSRAHRDDKKKRGLKMAEIDNTDINYTQTKILKQAPTYIFGALTVGILLLQS